MNNLLKFLDVNTERRKKIKKRIDSELNLSAEHGEEETKLSVYTSGVETNRLLDEGAIIEGDGSIFAYIKKGTLEKFLNRENAYLGNLPDDYVGNVNIGHFDHATFPFPVGEWTISDMKLVDIGEGRKGIDIDVKVDEESIFIKELHRLGYDVSMSAEFQAHTDWDASEDLGMWVIDEVLILAYAIVGDGKNVNSNGLQLKGETEDMKKEKIKVDEVELETVEAENEETVEATADETEEVVEAESETEVVTEVTEVTETETEETELSASEDTEEVEETGEETESEEADGEEAEGEEAYAKVETFVDELKDEIEQLKAENAELKKTNNRLQKKLKAELEKKEAFVNKFSSIASAMDVEEHPKENKPSDYYTGDGIGE